MKNEIMWLLVLPARILEWIWNMTIGRLGIKNPFKKRYEGLRFYGAEILRSEICDRDYSLLMDKQTKYKNKFKEQVYKDKLLTVGGVLWLLIFMFCVAYLDTYYFVETEKKVGIVAHNNHTILFEATNMNIKEMADIGANIKYVSALDRCFVLEYVRINKLESNYHARINCYENTEGKKNIFDELEREYGYYDEK